jgi:hypothetical protein
MPPVNQVLSYRNAPPNLLRRAAVSSVVVGCVSLLGNAFVAATMFKQMRKQATGRGATSAAFEPWLTLTAAEATLSAALAVVAILCGTAFLYRSKILTRSLVWFGCAKLVLALVFGIWAGWGMKLLVSARPVEFAAAATLAIVISAAHPIYILRTLRRSQARTSG